MGIIAIEKGIAIPEGQKGLYPYKDMEVGDSFGLESEGQFKSARSVATRYKKANPGWDFISDVNELRIWRIA